MTMLDRARSALVLVDFQGKLMPAIAGGRAVLDEAMFLAQIARALHVPVVGTEQNPHRLGLNDEALRVLCDHTVPKMHFGACADGLVDRLRSLGRDIAQVVIAGCETHVCLLQTALGLLDAGLQVAVVPGACGSRRRDDHALALSRLQQAGAILVNSEMVAFEWLGACTHPQFKHVLEMIKARPVN